MKIHKLKIPYNFNVKYVCWEAELPGLPKLPLWMSKASPTVPLPTREKV